MRKSASLLSTEVTDALQRAIEAALATALQEQKKKKKKKKKPAEPPQQLSEAEQQVAKTADGPTKPRRSRGGFRGRPPPPTFDFDELADSALLTETEAAAVGRWSTNTLSSWRERPDHPLKWTKVGGGRVRYRAGDVRQLLASGYRVQPGLPPIGDVAMTGPERA